MIPLNLTIAGFLSYRQPTNIDFSQFDIACISGANGAGKSTILDAITWALFGKARKEDDSIIHSHPQVKAAEVQLIFSYENNLYRVQRTRPRNKTTLLEFHIAQPDSFPNPFTAEDIPLIRWKPLTEHSVRETQARIQSVLRLDYETFINASFFLQGKADQFTTQNAGNRKRILSSILGLEIWEVYKQRAIELRRRVEAEVNLIDGHLAEINSELAEEEDRRKSLQEIQQRLAIVSQACQDKKKLVESYQQQINVLNEHSRQVENLRQRLEAVKENRNTLWQRLQERNQEKSSYDALLQKAGEIESTHQQYLAIRLELENMDKQLQAFIEVEKRRQEPLSKLNAERVRLQQEAALLEQAGQDAVVARQQIATLETERAQLEGQLDKLETELSQRQSCQISIQTIQSEVAALENDNKRLVAEMKELRQRIDQLQINPEEANCPLCGQSLPLLERETLIQNLTETGKSKKAEYNTNKEKISQLQIELIEFQTLQNTFPELETRARKLSTQIQDYTTRMNTLKEKVTKWEQIQHPPLQAIQKSLAAEDFLPDVRQELAQIETEIRNLGYDIDRHNALRQLENELRPISEEMQKLVQARATLAPLEREIRDIQKQIKTIDEEILALEQEYQNALVSLEQAKAQAPDLEQAEREWRNLEEQANTIRLELGVAQQKVNVLDDLKKRLQLLKEERDQKNRRVGGYKQLERAFGKDGIPALLIEQALPQIEEHANQILARLSNGSMALRFITQTEYKNKHRDDLKETLDILISDTNGIRDYELYSGGEAFRINFAIRLAISEVLAHRAGARLQTLVIDEGFGSQDAMGRQRLIEAINLVQDKFAKILVITHLDELKEAFPNRIEVVKTSEGSKAILY